MTRPVAVVVVAYNAAEQLERCLAALGAELEASVVDNSSSPAVRAVAENWGAAYIDPGRNLGFGAGANVALRQLLCGSPKDILLLNPDAAFEPREIDKLARYLRQPGNERVAAVSPRLVREDRREQRVVWPFPTPWRAWAEAAGLGRLPARRTFVIGAVLALRWEALIEVGLFDERFFLYAEEADWQRRALALGWSSRLCADAVALHRGGGTSTDRLQHLARFHAAQETYIRKWYGSAGWLFYRSAACLGASVRALVFTGDRRWAAAQRALLYFRGPRRCAGLAGD